jgi:hypothetical protein
MTFNGDLAIVADIVTLASNHGIWKSQGVGNELVVRSGSGGVPGVAGADFESFGAPLLNDADQILFRATLAAGVGGVTGANATGLWMAGEAGGSLVARTESGGVPGMPGANFSDFTNLAFNQSGIAAVRGLLSVGVGGVTATNDVGLWLLNSTGGGALIAREGTVIAGRTIADLDFVGGSTGGDGHARALNSAGQLLFKVTFTNGDEGLLLYSPALAADFNADGLINSADLTKWKSGFGTPSGASIGQGDADHDGDVDGADFLLWQRQASSTGGSTAAAPEPTGAALLLFGVAAGCLRLSREARFERGARAGRAPRLNE